MKRGWLILGFLILLGISLVNAKTFNLSECWGVEMCGVNYTCGVYDGICTNDFFSPNSEPAMNFGCNKPYNIIDDYNYSKCMDPDCSACVRGRVSKAPPNPNEGISGATVSAFQDVCTNPDNNCQDNIERIFDSTTTDDNGEYYLNFASGNQIYVIAEAQGFTPGLSNPLFNINQEWIQYNEWSDDGCIEINFSLSNGTCQGDCTRQGSNYCDMSCQGLGTPDDLCAFDQTNYFLTSDNRTLEIDTPYEKCTGLGVQSGTFVDVGSFTNSITGVKTCIRVGCCEGSPFEVPCPDTVVGESLISGVELDNAVKVTRIANYKGEPVKIRVYYWD